MINYTIQFLDEQSQNPIVGLPITRKFCWSANKLGFGSGCKTLVYKTDGNGNINFQLPNINPIEASGASSLVITTPNIKSTEYQIGYSATSTSYTVGSWENNTSVGKTILVPSIPYSSLTSTSTSTITQNTSYTNTTTSGQISNLMSSLSKYAIWIIIGIILIVALILIMKFKGSNSSSFPIGA